MPLRAASHVDGRARRTATPADYRRAWRLACPGAPLECACPPRLIVLPKIWMLRNLRHLASRPDAAGRIVERDPLCRHSIILVEVLMFVSTFGMQGQQQQIAGFPDDSLAGELGDAFTLQAVDDQAALMSVSTGVCADVLCKHAPVVECRRRLNTVSTRSPEVSAHERLAVLAPWHALAAHHDVTLTCAPLEPICILRHLRVHLPATRADTADPVRLTTISDRCV